MEFLRDNFKTVVMNLGAKDFNSWLLQEVKR
jgi:hypothetical protein